MTKQGAETPRVILSESVTHEPARLASIDASREDDDGTRSIDFLRALPRNEERRQVILGRLRVAIDNELKALNAQVEPLGLDKWQWLSELRRRI